MKNPPRQLLAWYDRNARTLPWREAKPDPYRVWLAEIMLQQTTVATVRDYFTAFIARWPNVTALAAADDDSVMAAWAGLGYYARARNLLTCARIIADERGGHFPETEAELLRLPGIGPYTAAAIAAIAFGQPSAAVDGNIERVLARFYGLTTPPPKLKSRVRALNAKLIPADRPGDFIQAQMDLGAMICTPKRPHCTACPWQKDCAARARNRTESLPRRAAKRPKPNRTGNIYWLSNGAGVLMRKRPQRGLLGGMLEFPSHGWDAANECDLRDQLPAAMRDSWQAGGVVTHIFTHFHLTLTLYMQTAPPDWQKPPDYQWVAIAALADHALPSLMRKIAALALTPPNRAIDG